jgi:hypothetical protein
MKRGRLTIRVLDDGKVKVDLYPKTKNNEFYSKFAEEIMNSPEAQQELRNRIWDKLFEYPIKKPSITVKD